MKIIQLPHSRRRHVQRDFLLSLKNNAMKKKSSERTLVSMPKMKKMRTKYAQTECVSLVIPFLQPHKAPWLLQLVQKPAKCFSLSVSLYAIQWLVVEADMLSTARSNDIGMVAIRRNLNLPHLVISIILSLDCRLKILLN